MDDGTTRDRNLQDLTQRAFTRRKLLKTGAFASAAIGLGTLLAACGSSDKATVTKSSGAGGGATAAGQAARLRRRAVRRAAAPRAPSRAASSP